MKKKNIIIPILLLASGIGLASCANSSSTAHSKSFEAGVAWVRNDFPGSDESICELSIFAQGANCAKAQSFCGSNAATFAVNDGNYNMQQWIDGCVSVPFKHWPKWLRNYVTNGN